MDLLHDPVWHQWLVFLLMVLAFVAGIWTVKPHPSRHPEVHMQSLAKDALPPARYSLSTPYRRYRNPKRHLRRFLGWPSGRQWRLLKKQWNRERPDGTTRFAAVVWELCPPTATTKEMA